MSLHLPAPRWLPGGHLQTIWPALASRHHLGPRPQFQRERWDTPDGDFVDVDWLIGPAPCPPQAPLLVMFHGLEGSSQSHYALALAEAARERGWRFAVPHFRGCSGEINRAPRAYHSGDFEEVGWMLSRFQSRHNGPILAVGISLGGNALLRWGQEAGKSAGGTVKALASVCSPIDLSACGHAMGRGFNRWVYTPSFLRSMKPKALLKLRQFPGLFDVNRLARARTLFEFDDVFTAPLHGFKGTQDYWDRAAAKPRLAQLRVPSLVVNALNDPFVPASSLPSSLPGDFVTLLQPSHGGHVGFPSGRPPGHVARMPQAVCNWFASRL